MGYAPESPLSNVMVTMKPVGAAEDCAARLVTNNAPSFSFGTMVGCPLSVKPPGRLDLRCLMFCDVLSCLAVQKNRVCQSSAYPFSNWITTSPTCKADYFNEFYQNSSLPSYNYIEQWYAAVGHIRCVLNDLPRCLWFRRCAHPFPGLCVFAAVSI
jgi:hypothetical protein